VQPAEALTPADPTKPDRVDELLRQFSDRYGKKRL
jgi:hypothetical protein